MLAFYLSLIETKEDQTKFELIYNEHRSLMKSTALKILKDDNLAEDAVNDAFIRIINNLSGINDIHSKKTVSFICLITRHASIDVLRNEFKNNHLSFDDINKYQAVNVNNIFENLEFEYIMSKYRLLPQTHKDIIELKIQNKYSDKQLAEHYGISPVAARKRLQRAREALNALLND